MISLRRCTVHGIEGCESLIHVVDQEPYITCGTCFGACPGRCDAISIISGQAVPPPIPEEERTTVGKGKEAGKGAE